ncbi:type I glyceraldehyde-3-phosphate dehydrogenase [Membranicola marinus]|uniref:Glyceraldehyde-3-phosphate dehydrogenase n=1 Tax=Membranihabitans marinus TaxID=1227546 RepID=A0A953L853_9BACT|nr:type I glyceraldehyde-3-phosphate dehydrogenase [Membranihabitans marinus]MBY5957330.1 type I glyceraldehyde-3-phosphate dehydrogenase [Membranihabitans marinus]
MAKKIAINGFGRIGRLTFRSLLDNDEVQVVAINDLTDNDTLAHLLKYDTAHGTLDHEVTADHGNIFIDGEKVVALSERDPAKLPWDELGVDFVLECTGIFRSREQASKHLEAGAKKVLISAPAQGDVKTIVLGVNEEEIDPEETIFSNASCTTNCLAPVVKLLDENYGIKTGSMSTIHAYTADQNIQDAPHKDLRRARAAAQNIVPTSTGAAKAVRLVYPAIGDKIMAMAYRVPTLTGSLIDMTVKVEKPATAEEVNAIFKKASEGDMKGILKYETDPIVSSDIIGSPYSSIFDVELTTCDDDFIRVVSWYDNEAGYSTRLGQLAIKLATL